MCTRAFACVSAGYGVYWLFVPLLLFARKMAANFEKTYSTGTDSEDFAEVRCPFF
jgi:hypothetical protein